MTTPIRHLMCAAWAAMATSAAAAQDSYLGMCDASAAVALGQGHFVVADDESDVPVSSALTRSGACAATPLQR